MAAVQRKVLIVLFLLSSISIFAEDSFIGTWRYLTPNPEEDPFIAISKVAADEYFVIHVSPFGNHQLDYASYGFLDDQGYIVIESDGEKFFLELYDDGLLYQNWNSRIDYNALGFYRVTSEPFKDNYTEQPSIEEFYLFIQSQLEK